MIKVKAEGKDYIFKDDLSVNEFDGLGEFGDKDFERKFLAAMSHKPRLTLAEVKQLPMKLYRKLTRGVNDIYLTDFQAPPEESGGE